MRRLGPWLAVAACAGLIFWLSSLSNPLPFLPSGHWSIDKLGHAAEYALLAALCARALAGSVKTPGRVLLGAWFLATLYGASDEWHQSFVPGRSADVLDLAADAAGAAVGALLSAGFLRARGARASIPR